MSDNDFPMFVQRDHQLALLTEEETRRLDALKRSAIAADRLARAGIRLVSVTETDGSSILAWWRVRAAALGAVVRLPRAAHGAAHASR